LLGKRIGHKRERLRELLSIPGDAVRSGKGGEEKLNSSDLLKPWCSFLFPEIDGRVEMGRGKKKGWSGDVRREKGVEGGVRLSGRGYAFITKKTNRCAVVE